jgi:pyruvate/2-oxoglutarate/acetoin dehydrogenase E1 component
MSVARTGRLLVIEEGSAYAGIGAELITQVTDRVDFKITAKRIASYPVPIPSVKSLEHTVLPDKERIIHEIKMHFL